MDHTKAYRTINDVFSSAAESVFDISEYRPSNNDMYFGGSGLGSNSSLGLGQNSSTSRPITGANNAFPPIGTFSLDSIGGSSNNSSSNMFSMDSLSNGMSNSSMGGGGGGSNRLNMFGGNNGMSSGGHPNNATGNNPPGNNPDLSQGIRETGIIEKLLHSYGFIQCCERQARLFFHFSQFGGNIEHLKIGDPVEFEMTYDRRTGKPIASQVTKIAPEVVLSEERVTGTVTTELKTDANCNSNNANVSSDTTGRISYENRGECFFLPYTKDDVEGNVTLHAGDKVSFQIATNNRGNLGACHIRLENPAHPVKYRGVVCSMKESFGFIERADVVKEIFFHFSEAEGNIELRPGDDVEFTIQTRNGKEVACNISRLAPGSVIFEDVGTQIYRGQVLKPLDRTPPNSTTAQRQPSTDPLPGRIRYRNQVDHSEVEVPFGDKDQKGDFTLRHGDWVQFYLATDRRDQLQRATAISLLDDSFNVSGEKREQGVVASLKEGFGFVRCVERSVRLFFHFTEVLDTSREICVGDEVEFTVVQDPASSYPNTRYTAIRIKHLPVGTVQFETLVESGLEGVITREAPKSPVKTQERTDGGVISYIQGNNKKTIMYFLKDCEKPPRVGDNVRFDIYQVKRNKELIAINVVEIFMNHDAMQQQLPLSRVQSYPASVAELMQQQQRLSGGDVSLSDSQNGIAGLNDSYYRSNSEPHAKSSPGKVQYGFIAVLKENFGFIETTKHDQEVFFHFSNFIGNPTTLELGQEVEYTLSARNGLNAGNCIPAENVKVIPANSIPQPMINFDKLYNGVVVRPIRCINPDQPEYCGLIQMKNDDGTNGSVHEFGITSVKNKRDLLQKDDVVTFRLDQLDRARQVEAVRQKNRSSVDSIKGQFGFLDYEVEEGKKLFFHMSEVQSSTILCPGDVVEFSIVTNQRNGKNSACTVVKIADGSRPERLLSRLKLNSVDESVPRVTVLRSPKGPDGSKGFHSNFRTPRPVGAFIA
ncbi:cold shock domain-containing protein E1 [Culicoides brevitarsis]|uniref:cold shock domain-containing protein E1 n=1 Tax=Culicoides brevitarsis TaxID=469753 RepID=UPI00307C9951